MEPWSPELITVFDTVWGWLKERCMYASNNLVAFDDDGAVYRSEVEALSKQILEKLKGVK